jgi:hypothetical protein
MARYIDAEKIDFSPLKDDFDRARAKVIIMGQPTADVAEVKHGKWICLEAEIGYFACSECDHRILRAECNYCPNCGAKMDGGVTDDQV